MLSNFEFLNKDILTQQYYEKANEAELSYVSQLYSATLVAVRTVAENVAREVADFNYLIIDERDTFDNVLKRLRQGNYINKDSVVKAFYDIKGPGNAAAHTLEKASQEEALKSLKNLYSLSSPVKFSPLIEITGAVLSIWKVIVSVFPALSVAVNV